VHLPPHPVWFWLVLAGPYLAWLGLWVIVNIFEVSVKPLAPWLWAGYFVFLVPYLFCGFAISGRHRTFCRISGVVAWGCYSIAFWIKRRYTFETLRGQGAKWYLPWSGAEFSIAARTRILGTGR